MTAQPTRGPRIGPVGGSGQSKAATTVIRHELWHCACRGCHHCTGHNPGCLCDVDLEKERDL